MPSYSIILKELADKLAVPIKILFLKINYYAPIELLITMAVVFSAENITELIFKMYLSSFSEIAGWFGILIISSIIAKEWADESGNSDELREQIDDVKEGNDE